MNSKDFNQQNNNLINSNENINNDLISSQEFIVNFINSKFLWKELMKLNTKYIERSGDISIITPYVQNILCSRLTLDTIDMISEEYIIQLVTLLQLTGQYLVYTQKMLEAENEQLREQISYLKNNLTDTEKYQRIIDELNRQNKEKDYLINTYRDMGQAGNRFNDADLKNNKNKKMSLKNNPEFNESKKNYYYCRICSGKKFKSQKYLDEHMERRHFNQREFFKTAGEREERKSQEKNYRKEFEMKLNSLKNELESMIKQKEENNELALLNQRLELIQNQIVQQNYNNIISPKSNINYKANVDYSKNIIKREQKVDYQKRNEEPKKENKELTKMLEEQNKRMEEQEKWLRELSSQVNQIENNKIINKKPYQNNDILQKKYNITETTEENGKNNVKRHNNKFNTNDMIININQEYNNEQKNINEEKVEKREINKNNENKEKNNDLIEGNNPKIEIEKKNQEVNNNEQKEPKLNSEQNQNQNDKKIFINTETPQDGNDAQNVNYNNKNNNNKNSRLDFNDISDIKNITENKNIFYSLNENDNNNNEKLKTQKDINNKDVKNSNSPFINSINLDKINEEKNTLTVSKFYEQFEERNKNYKGEYDYNKIKIPEKYNVDIENEINKRKEKIREDLNDSNITNNIKKLIKNKDNRNQIYKQYNDKINEALNIEAILNSYNNYQKEKNKNQMIVNNSSSKERVSINNKSGTPKHSGQYGQSFTLKTSLDDDYTKEKNIPNPYKK